ncbi:hypothetical protein KY358_02845 [Candidatus Woesearchaeota archaeon]|nr:hypothetical protein [Candidatus Woesearchaeota archaeon]
MVEFNPDGSIRLPSHIQSKKEEDRQKLKRQRCILVRKEVISFRSPKRCLLKITVSDAISDTRFIATLYNHFREKAAVPSKLIKVDEKNFNIELGTDFRRCTDCTSLISSYREFLDGNIIEDKGACPFEGRKRDFCYEDYFD